MAPKKKEAEVKKPILGRFSHNLKMGIVGLPNVGKSMLFNTLTHLNVDSSNYPFCTIEPNEARVAVPDDRFDWLCSLYNPASKVQAALQIWDIAGLVKGASEGQGLGNAFLSNIQAVDGIFHVVRVFEDPDVIHVENSVDPVRDMEIIDTELLLKDLDRVNKLLVDLDSKVNRFGNNVPKELKFEADTLHKVKDMFTNDKLPVRAGNWSASEIEILNNHLFLTAKPTVYLVNMSVDDYKRKKNKWLGKIKEYVDGRTGELIIPISTSLEAKLQEVENSEGHDAMEAYCKEHEVTSAIGKIVKTGYSGLNLIYYFTAGADECKCWTIRRGTLAPQAAGQIHGDFEKGFVKAEVMAFDALKELGSESAVKAAGKYRSEGKQYEVHDGDIIYFRFNVASGGKAAAKK